MQAARCNRQRVAGRKRPGFSELDQLPVCHSVESDPETDRDCDDTLWIQMLEMRKLSDEFGPLFRALQKFQIPSWRTGRMKALVVASSWFINGDVRCAFKGWSNRFCATRQRMGRIQTPLIKLQDCAFFNKLLILRGGLTWVSI